MSVRLSSEEIQYIHIFESITGTIAKDCIIIPDADWIIFLVNPGQVGIAVGKDGKNIRQLKSLLKKNIEVVEFSYDLKQFTKNCFRGVRILDVKLEEVNSKRIVRVIVRPEDKGLAIGRHKRNLTRARLLLRRHFKIDDVVVSSE
ncbi:MAG: NusA-like transcription termination signal-binding factor [Candidatus Asgardarchaeia archaeon]